jgi:hypothetical protein
VVASAARTPATTSARGRPTTKDYRAAVPAQPFERVPIVLGIVLGDHDAGVQ